MSKALQTAIIGTGMIANAAHLAAIQYMDQKLYDVVAVADIREEAARETADRFDIPHVYTDSQKMLRDVKPDVVIVATPNASHKQAAFMALEAGANVICEKPVVLTYADAVELFEEAEKRGLHFFPAQTERFKSMRQSCRRILEEKLLGEVYFAEFEAVRRRGIPKWGFFHMKEYNIGGPFCDLGVHEIDHMVASLGNPKALSVSGSAWTKIGNTGQELQTDDAKSGATGGIQITPRPYDWHEFSVEDMATGIIRLEGDLTINFKTAWAVNLPERWTRSFAGTRVGMLYDNDNLTVYGDMAGWQSDIRPMIFEEAGYPGELPFPGHVGLLKNVAAVLRGEAEPVVRKEETLNITSIIEAFYISAKEHREVLCEEITGKCRK